MKSLYSILIPAVLLVNCTPAAHPVPTVDLPAIRSTALAQALTLVARTPTSSPSPAPTATLARSPEGTLWEGYFSSIDWSIGCPDFPARPTDVQLEFGEILRLTADPGTGGVFLGAIGARRYPFVNNSTYVLTGEFRKPSGNPELISVNLQYIDAESREHYAEITWGLNPHSPLYGWIWTRTVLDEQILLTNIGDDTRWHRFELKVEYGDRNLIRRVSVDGHSEALDLPMGRIQQEHAGSFAVLLEVENMYTNCTPDVATRGVSEWRNIQLHRCRDEQCLDFIDLD